MHGVLIVDDEKYVRLWLRNCINWADFGMEIVGEANSGKDALKKINDLHPRVVISDMDMPEMNGAELIDQANVLEPEILFLILSGYNTYEFMRSAVRNNAIDYLLKPIDEESLILSIRKLLVKIEQYDQNKMIEKRLTVVQNDNRELQKKEFLFDLIEGQSYTEEVIIERLSELGIQADSKAYKILSIWMDEQNVRLPESDIQTIITTAKNIFSLSGMTAWFFARGGEIIGLLVSIESDHVFEQKIMIYSQKLIQNLQVVHHLSATVGLGSTISDCTCIGSSYVEAKHAQELRFLYGKNQILSFHDVPGDFNKDVISIGDEQKLSDVLQHANAEAAQDIIHKIFKHLPDVGVISLDTIKMVYFRLVSIILKEIYTAGIAPVYLKIEEIDLFTAFSKLNSLQQIQNQLLVFVNTACVGIAETKAIRNTGVAKAIDFISQNYKSDISLTEIASKAYLTPSYFSALFKSETGKNVMDYISDLRIKEVKILMKDNRLKTYDIRMMVGYTNPKYFCRVFKKVTGQSPSQFRRSIK